MSAGARHIKNKKKIDLCGWLVEYFV